MNAVLQYNRQQAKPVALLQHQLKLKTGDSDVDLIEPNFTSPKFTNLPKTKAKYLNHFTSLIRRLQQFTQHN